MAIRVLVVDDLPFMREAIRDILQTAGIHVAGEAENGKQMIYRYAALEPDVVLLDITMPVMDGITALRKLLRFDPKARVVMCSALGEQSMILKAIQIGAKDFIVKPFKSQRVVSAVSKVMGIDGS
jgi:two-component system chemotaxis response regulator CheY